MGALTIDREGRRRRDWPLLAGRPENPPVDWPIERSAASRPPVSRGLRLRAHTAHWSGIAGITARLQGLAVRGWGRWRGPILLNDSREEAMILDFRALLTREVLRLTGVLQLVAMASLTLPSTAQPQDPTPQEVVDGLGLESVTVGRVTAFFAPSDRDRAVQLATLSEAAAVLFDQELGLSFEFGLAALSPDDWFSEFPGIPYAIPWVSISERLLFVPSSLREGLLIQGRSEVAGRRHVDFVTLHEYGHVAAKEYYRPLSQRAFVPIPWFGELVATYFGYAYVRSVDLEWADSAQAEWAARVDSYTPRVVSLDWTFMESLPGSEVAPTYAWYQYLLNLRVAELYEVHGIGFLRTLRDDLPWDSVDDWTTESLLIRLEEISPGFRGWADGLRGN